MGEQQANDVENFIHDRLRDWPNPVQDEDRHLADQAYDNEEKLSHFTIKWIAGFWVDTLDRLMRGYELVADESTGQSVYIVSISGDFWNPDEGRIVVSDHDYRQYVHRANIREILYWNNHHPIWGNIGACEVRAADRRRYADEETLDFVFFAPDVDPRPEHRDALIQFLAVIPSWNESPIGYNLVLQSIQNKYGNTAAKYFDIVTMPSGKLINLRASRHTGRTVDELFFLESQAAFDEFCRFYRSYNQRMANQAMRAIKLPPDIIDKITDMSLGTISEVSKQKRERINRESGGGPEVVRNKRRAPAAENEPPVSRPRHQPETKEREVKDNRSRAFDIRFVTTTDSHGRRWLHKYVNGQEVFEGLNWPQEQAPDEQVRNMSYIEWVAINAQRAAENLPPLPRPETVSSDYQAQHSSREEELKLLRNREREARRQAEIEASRREYEQRTAAERAAQAVEDAEYAQQFALEVGDNLEEEDEEEDDDDDDVDDDAEGPPEQLHAEAVPVNLDEGGLSELEDEGDDVVDAEQQP